MMKKMTWRAAIVLLCAVALLMPASVVAQAENDAIDAISVTEQTKSGEVIQLSGTAPGSCLFAACYDANGKMLELQADTTSGEGFTVSVPSENARLVNLYALGDKSQPVASAVRTLVIAEGETIQGGSYDQVLITSDVGNGDVTLEGVTITGKLIVEGGGSNSIHLESCAVDAIQVNKDTSAQDAEEPRIELKNTPVETIEAVKPVIIEAVDEASTIATVEAQSDVTVQGENTTVQNVTAAAENVKLTVQNAAVEKVAAENPVTIEATGENSVIKEVEAKSDVTVQGENTTVQNVTAAAENVKLTVQNAAVEKVAAENPVTIEATGENSVIKEVEAKSNVTVQGATTKVDKVTVPESAASTGVELKIEGAKVAEVAAEKPVTIEATNGASPIEKVEAKDNVTVQGAQIETVTVPENVATKPEITVTSGTVSTVEAKSEVKVEGGGTVSNVKAEAPVEVNSATVTTITVTVQVTVTVTGTQPVEVAVETTNAVSVVTENTNVSVSTTLTEEVNVVTKATEEAVGTKVAHVHKWVEDTTQYVAPTCSATGKRVYVCGGVGECDVTERTKTETLPKLPHTEKIVSAVAATCTGTGLTAGKVCAVCDVVLVKQTETPALEHNYAEVWSSDSTGHWHECLNCGDKINFAAHTPGAAATETTDQTCTVCGYVVTPSGGHKCANHLTKTAAKAATCTVAGNSEYYTCTCGKFYSDANATHVITKDRWIIPATGHYYGTATYEWKTVSGGYTCTATRVCSHNENHKETETVTASYEVTNAPTCSAVGSGTYTAKFTNQAFAQQTQTKTVEIAKLLHKEETIPGKAATCEETGLTDGVKCSVCQTVLVAQEEIPALGHDWATGWSKDETYHWHVCQREGCDAVNEEAEHSWNEGAVTTPATGTQDGVKTYTCTDCAATKTEVIPSTNTVVTSYDDFVHALEDNTVTGITVNADIIIPAQDHWNVLNVSKPVVVAAGKTLTVAGYTTGGDKSGFLANDLTVAEGGSLTLSEGAVLKTTSVKNGEDEPFYRYVGRICVCGGTLDVSAGTVENSSFFNFNYVGQTTNSNALILGENTPEIEFAVHNDAQLRAAIADPKCTGGVIVEDNITLESDLSVAKLVLVNNEKTLTVPAGKTLTIAENGMLQVSGTLNVYGTLANNGEIFNLNTINVFGGTLTNHANIISFGELGIENGARIESNFEGAVLSGHVTATDFWRDDEEVKKCTWDAAFEPASGDFEVRAVAFGTTQIQAALNDTSSRYECVVACGTDAEPTVNTVELGGITVHEGGKLWLCNWSDGTNVYINNYKIGEDKTLTLENNARLECYTWGMSDHILTIDGRIVNNGGSFDFGDFTVNGKNAPQIVHSEEELIAALAKGGDIYLYPFAQENRTDVSAAFDNPEGTDWESQYHLKGTHTISKNTTLIGLGGEPIAVFFDAGFTVNSGVTLTLNGLNAVAVQDSTVNGTVKALDGMMVVQGAENTTLTVSETGKIVVGQPNRWGGLAIFAENNKIVNNGTIENFAELSFDRWDENQFSGNEPIEYASLRDLVCELYHRFDGMPNMESVDCETTNQWGIEDLHWVYDYPDGGSQMYNKEKPDDSDYDAIGAFSWFIKNGIIPQYNKDTNPILNPYALVTKGRAAELLNKLGNKILGTTDESYSTLSGSDYLCRTENIAVPNEEWKTSELRQAVDGLEAHFASLRSVSVTSENELLAALNTPYVTEIHVTQSMTILGTPDSSDTNFAGCFYLHNNGRNGDLNIYIYGKATLTVGSAERTTKLDIGEGVNVILIQIEGSHAKVEVSKDSCVNVFGGLNVNGENWNYEEYFSGNICRFPDVMEFGERLLECVGAYELPAMEDDELAANRDKVKEWPDGDGRIDGFELLVKHGKLAPHAEKDDQGKDYIVWRPYEKITYGVAIGVLENVYKAIDKEATGLPDTVALGDEQWTPNPNDLINDHDLKELLNKFVDVLPKVTDNETEGFTLIRDTQNEGEGNRGNDGMTITGKTFTQHITITCDTQYLNNGDDFGGELRFVNCEFVQGVTIEALDGINFRVDFTGSCSGADGAAAQVTVNAPVIPEDAPEGYDGYTYDENGEYHHNVELCGTNNMHVTANTYLNICDVKNQAFDLTFSGSTVNFDGAGKNTPFDVNVRWDRWYDRWEEEDGGHSELHAEPCVQIDADEKSDKTEAVKLVGQNFTSKLRVCGYVDVSGLSFGKNGWLELANNRWRSDIDLGGNTIFVNNDCGGEYCFTGTADSKVIVRDQNQSANITVNGMDLGTPHIFGEHGDGIFFPLANAAIGDNNTLTVNGKAVTFIVEQGNQTLNYAFDIKQDRSGVHLNPVNGKPWITNPNDVRVTVTVGGCSVVYDTMMWKPITETEFADKLNQMLSTSYTFETSNKYLTYGKAKEILSTAWKTYNKTAEEPDMGELIHDDNYWSQRVDWNQRLSEAENPEKWLEENEGWNPDNWTRDWFFANDVIRNLRDKLGIAAQATTVQDLLNALADGFSNIQVTEDITLLDGEKDDENFAGSVYLNRADGVDQQRIYVQPGVKLTVGDAEHRIKLDIGDGVNIILCVDNANAENHGVLQVNSGSCVNVFGGLETPEDLDEETYDSYVVRAKDANVSYMKRIAEFGGRLYERLLNAGKVEALNVYQLAAYAGEDSWPDDDWSRQGMAFLETYAGLTKKSEGDREYWPSWDYARYGDLMELLEKVYHKLAENEDANLPGSVMLENTQDDNILDDNGIDTLIDRFVASLPQQDDSETESFTVTRDDGMTISGKKFTKHITITCDTQYLTEGDDFGGCIFFENCDFTSGVTVELKQGINYGIRFNNCTGTVLTIKNGETTLAPLTLGGSNIAVDVRYDGDVPTAEICSESKEPETITVSGRDYSGKLRISGMADVSGLSFGKNGWLELSNNSDSTIALDSNNILVNDDCGGHYTFTGTGTVIVPNQNQYANITVNGINLGTPHVFGRNDLAIFFPLTGTWNEEGNFLTVNEETVTFTVEQGQYSEEQGRVPDNAWTTLEFNVDASNEDMIHLVGKQDNEWLRDPYQVRVTVTVANGCTVVYDTMMWKPVQMDEFITELNTRLNKGYTLEALGITKTEGDLTFGACKTAFATILVEYEKTETVDMNTIINDGGYWDELARWNASEDEHKEDWNPDNWTRRWNDLDEMLNKLTEVLGISADT